MNSRVRRFRRRLPSGDGGATALELAFIAPSLIIVIFGLIQTTFWLYGRSVANSAARDAVSSLRLAQTKDAYDHMKKQVTADTLIYAAKVGSGALKDVDVKPQPYNTPQGKVTVTVTGSSLTLVPFFTLHISQTANGQIERFDNQP